MHEPDQPLTGSLTASDEAFEQRVLRYLRSLADPCAPPVGAGSFLLLYASADEVVVWFEPSAEHQRPPGEVLIPCALLANAWETLTNTGLLDLPALQFIAGGMAGAHWLLALLALLPGVRVSPEPLALIWAAPTPSPSPVRGRGEPESGGHDCW